MCKALQLQTYTDMEVTMAALYLYIYIPLVMRVWLCWRQAGPPALVCGSGTL